MSRPRALVVEYEDSTRREVAFSELREQAQLELAALGLCDAPSRASSKGFLLLEWKDGWKEVVAVNGRATELLRYYSIERVEEVGRLSLDVPGATPELLTIKRLPGSINTALFVGSDEVQAYAFEEKLTVKEGAKIEHVFYDKKRPAFSKQEAATASALYTGILNTIEKELSKRGMSAASLLAANQDERLAVYKQLTSILGLRAAERQQHLYEFIEAAVERIGNPEAKAQAAASN